MNRNSMSRYDEISEKDEESASLDSFLVSNNNLLYRTYRYML